MRGRGRGGGRRGEEGEADRQGLDRGEMDVGDADKDGGKDVDEVVDGVTSP